MQTVLENETRQADMTKKCPFCAEEIQAEAIKCRFCNEFLTDNTPQKKKKWYYSPASLVIAFLFIGPLAIPLAWLNPRFNIITKLLITIAMLGITVLLLYAVGGLYNNLTRQIHQLGM